jgi:hypothetical protein
MEAMGKNLGGSVMLFLVPKIVETIITWVAKQQIVRKSQEKTPFRNPKNPGNPSRCYALQRPDPSRLLG